MRIFAVLLCILPLSILKAEVFNLNKGWDFQRISSISQQGEIRNQGSDWSSQFNVVHESSSARLAVEKDTINNELTMLAKGEWASVNLPHTAFIEDLVVLHQWQGICYYRRKLDVSQSWTIGEIWLEFGAAMNLADIWINGYHVMQHAGGYLPFVANIGKYLKAGDKNEILVRLDNRDNELIPPGKPLNTLDFCYYSGLYRDVNLIVKAKQHITHPILADQVAGGGVFVSYPLVTKEKAEVQIKCEIANTANEIAELKVHHYLYTIDGLFGKGKKGKMVVECEEELTLKANERINLRNLLSLENPLLWSPEHPYLYLLVTEITADGKVIDREETRIGIRHIEMSREKGFLLNGEPLRLVGSNRHMEYPYVGNALSNRAQYRDIYQIRTNGFNLVRLGHYPQDPSVLDACDELGLLAIEPIPGWQYFNKDSVFIQNSFKDIRHMIRRDRNHPSVIMWETTLNEAWPPNEWKDEAVKIAHEEYPGNQCYTSGDAYGYDGFDVSYNDWQEGYKRPNNTNNPGFIREYYDYEFGGHFSTTRISRADGERALLQNAWNAQWSHNRYRKMYPMTMGDAVWSMYDYNRGCCDNICYSGVADVFRLPKYSLDFYRTQVAQGENGPAGKAKHEVFIATRWDKRPQTFDTLIVFGNVDEVEIKINGQTVARSHADKGIDTEYVKYADKGNCRNLTYPPFTFTGIKWESGNVQAVGYDKGKVVAKAEVKTPKGEKELKISYFEGGYPAATDDLLIVYVSLLDENGTLIPNNGSQISLVVDGGEVQGPTSYNTEAGIASFIVKTGDERKLHLTASSDSGLSKDITIRLLD